MEIARDAQPVKAISRHVLEQVLASISEGILLLDARDSDLRIVYANPAYVELSGYSKDELIGRPWRLVQRDEERSPGLAQLRSAVGRAEPCELTILDVNKDGSTWFSFVQVSPLLDKRGDVRYFLCRQTPASEAARDANVEVDLLQRELGHARQRIASLSQTDPVTGLLNYRHFNSLLTRDLAVARREGRSISVLLFEVVEIDVYRKTFGSNAADSCLRMIGAQVAGAFRRAGDLCARRDDATIVVAAQNQCDGQIESLTARVADKVRGLGLHNPRAPSGRYLTVRCASTQAVPGSDEAEMLVERCVADLAKKATDAPKSKVQAVR